MTIKWKAVAKDIKIANVYRHEGEFKLPGDDYTINDMMNLAEDALQYDISNAGKHTWDFDEYEISYVIDRT